MTRDLYDIAADIGQLEVQVKWAGRKLERALIWREGLHAAEVAADWIDETIAELRSAQQTITELLDELIARNTEGETDGSRIYPMAGRTRPD